MSTSLPHPTESDSGPAVPALSPESQEVTAGFASLHGQVAVVTGASSGIGRAIAWELARGGADLILHCRSNLAGIEETAQQIRAQGRQAWILTADFADETALVPFVERCCEIAFPDIWVHNAGIDLLTGEAREWSYAEKLNKLLAVDLRATMLVSRAVAARMVAEKRGVLLHIGWDQAERGMEGDSGELFAAAKNGVMGFSRSLAVSVAPHVRVNCIAPGWIKTAWGESVGESWHQRVLAETPLKRWGLPADIARLARFLVSQEAAYLTGQVIYANGGAER